MLPEPSRSTQPPHAATTSHSSEAVIVIDHVTRSFGKKVALDDASLVVPRGKVFGLIGGNGAGKTTLIKHVLGMLKAQAGSVRVFGRDPVQDPVGVLGRIGYLSEERDLPDWMNVGELMSYTQAFFPSWDPAFAEELRESFELDRAARVKKLSRGQRARAGLLTALAHRPDLLVLDEPSSGLDPVVRRDILGAIIRTVADEGRTVLFSSHLLDEVERVADTIAIIHEGRVLLTGELDAIQGSHSRLTVRFAQPYTTRPQLAGALSTTGSGNEWTFVCNGDKARLLQEVESLGGRVVAEAVPSLDEIFVSRIGKATPSEAAGAE